ncbi:unnamed protein product [Hydatigera taeniaeformis]|uniref:Integrase_H2C2 domain-containing protein n=1 Tax=Hydatigena taeniaeformis TaxID=6205 RepID=A0A0R3X2X6_HYDTA|nr:unnamed protein product [Hydatigera taeniaeformis]
MDSGPVQNGCTSTCFGRTTGANDRLRTSLAKPTVEEMRLASKRAKQIWQNWNKLSLEDDVMWYKDDDETGSTSLVVPGSLVQPSLLELYEQLGHVGDRKMLDIARKRYWWSSMTSDVPDFCCACVTCTNLKNSTRKAMAPLDPMATGFSGDIIGSLPTAPRGNRYILVMLGYFTKVAEAEPLWAQDAESCVLRLKENLRKVLEFARRQLQKAYDRQSRTSVFKESDLVQLYRPIPPPGTHRKFYHPWSKEPYRIIKVLPPTNYLVRNAEIVTRPQTVHHNEIRAYTGPSPEGYEGEVYAVPEKEHASD